MTDTPSLDERDARFVAEYMKDKNASAACERAGIPPNQARRLLSNPDIAAEIARRTIGSASEEPAGEVSLETLIADARAAYGVAKDGNNAAAMVSAVTLLGRLTDKLDGAAEASEPAPVDTRDCARAVLEVLRQAADAEGISIGFALPGQRLIRVPEALAPLVGGLLPYASFDEAAAAKKAEPEPTPEPPKPVFKIGERETFDNGCWIEFVEIPTGGRPTPITKWAIYSAGGALLGYRLERAAAVEVALGVSNE